MSGQGDCETRVVGDEMAGVIVAGVAGRPMRRATTVRDADSQRRRCRQEREI